MPASIQFYAGITDPIWFEFLANLRPDEVNFWRPKNQNRFAAIRPGELFIFKLKGAPFFVGGGVFARHSFFPLPYAWRTFEQKNGASDYESFENLILPHRPPEIRDRPLGCTVIVEPFFWPRELWIPAPDEWRHGVQVGKVYDTADAYGAQLWSMIQTCLQGMFAGGAVASSEVAQARYGEPRLIRPRLGQGAFQLDVTDAYLRRCAITGEKTLPVLAACHIKPYSKHGPHETRNGLLLRSDLHNLFDLGYLTVTLEHRVEVSRRIREEFENGREYYALHGTPLKVLPKDNATHPAREFLEWHNGIFKR